MFISVKQFVLAIMIMHVGAWSQTTNLLRNGSFERFAGDDPQGWETTNIPTMLTVVSQTTRSAGGKFAVKCEVKDFHGSKIGGMIIQKGVKVEPGPIRLSGSYLLHVAGGDVGYAAISFLNDEGSMVGTCEQKLPATKEEFIPFEIVTTVPANGIRLDLQITMLAGSNTGNLHEQSWMILDDLALTPFGKRETQVQ